MSLGYTYDGRHYYVGTVSSSQVSKLYHYRRWLQSQVQATVRMYYKSVYGARIASRYDRPAALETHR